MAWNRNRIFQIFAFVFLLISPTISSHVHAQGTWSSVATLAPDYNGGVALLLTDGSVIVKTYYGGFGATSGTTWDRLTPDSTGSYIHGTWSTIAQMNNDRLYFSSWVLNDGRVYVGGGEYGAGTNAEIYDPVANTWTALTTPGDNFMDGSSESLPGGKLLLGAVSPNSLVNYVYDPATNIFTAGPSSTGSHAEVSWLKLPDSSVLQVDIYSTNSERYIPATNSWVPDATLPVMIYDSFDLETGASLLLPDGRGFFLGSTGHTALYTPSGNSSPGSWSAGPDIPGGLVTTDAPAAMMNNGKVLVAAAPAPVSGPSYPSPTSFFEFDYTTNSFTAVSAPGGGSTLPIAPYTSNMLDLPDGSVLFSSQASKHYYIYTPGGSPVSAGKPTVDSIIRINCDTLLVTGKLFTGISEGAGYGDDWATATNFPIVQICSGTRKFFAKSYNWNRYGTVSTGIQPDSAYFILPAGFGPGNFTLQVIANGNASAPASFSTNLGIITSAAPLCPGIADTLYDSSAAGLWSSANTGIATIGSSSGVITGVAAGTTVITYSIGACFSTATVTVNPLPAAISGTTSICAGSVSPLTCTTSGGTWATSNSVNATIGSGTGLLSGVAAGPDTVYYTLSSGCYSSVIATINPLPAPVSGPSTVCTGSTITLTSSSSGGSWTSGASTVAAAGSATGIISGISSGTAAISYTLPTGCRTATSVTVNPPPSAISGTTSACQGLTATLTNSGGGLWMSGTTAVATVGSLSGIVSGISAGSAMISYVLPTGCYSVTSFVVNPLPAAISGSGAVCYGATVTLSETGGGTWTSGNPGVFTVGSASGIVTGIGAGNSVVTYTLPTGCLTTAPVTVNPLPSAITGANAVCAGHSTTLSDAGGGSWGSANISVASVGSASGSVTGNASGTTNITYTLPSGCFITTPVTVNPLPSGITGTATLYLGSSLTLSDATPSGIWTSSSPSMATIGTSSGVVTGVSGGTPTITYTLLATGCYAIAPMSVNGTPAPISGPASVCQGSTGSFSDASAGGTWSSSNTAVASVGSSTGIVTGVANGTATITYSIGANYVTKPVSVTPAPGTTSGPTAVCTGSTITLSNSGPGGTWSSTNTSLATVGSLSGIVSGLSGGVDTIAYATSCGTPVKYPVTVSALPSAGSISGSTGVCVGSTITLTDAAGGGHWSAATGVATIGSSSGVVTGVAMSADIITYTVNNSYSCTASITANIYVEGTPGNIYTFSGTGTNSYTGDGAPAYLATMQGPRDMVTDNAGNIYFTDVSANVVRKISTTGIITTIAGNGSAGYSGDGGPATAATLSGPNGLFIDNAGNMFISNTNSNSIRKVNAATGIITTVAGTPGVYGATGDGGPATAAKLSAPLGITGDVAGNMYICDQSNYKVRKIDGTTGIITTFAGNGSNAYGGDGGPASAARLSSVRGVALDKSGNLYIADGPNHVIRKVVLATGIITTVAGNGVLGSGGDGGAGTAAQLNSPTRICYDGGSLLYIADMSNNNIRQLNLSTGKISTAAGTGTSGFSGDGAPATASKLYQPYGVTFDKQNNLYLSDAANRRIRAVATKGSIGISGPTSVPAGSSVTYIANASISTGVTYQWQRNNVNIGSGAPFYTNTAPANGDVYRCILTITPQCGSAYNDTSNAISLSVFAPPSSDPALVNSLGNDRYLLLYPNPGHSSITVEADELTDGEAIVRFIDELGKQQKEIRTTVMNGKLRTAVDVSDLPAAWYIVTATDTSGRTMRIKFVKN